MRFIHNKGTNTRRTQHCSRTRARAHTHTHGVEHKAEHTAVDQSTHLVAKVPGHRALSTSLLKFGAYANGARARVRVVALEPVGRGVVPVASSQRSECTFRPPFVPARAVAKMMVGQREHCMHVLAERRSVSVRRSAVQRGCCQVSPSRTDCGHVHSCRALQW